MAASRTPVGDCDDHDPCNEAYARIERCAQPPHGAFWPTTDMIASNLCEELSRDCFSRLYRVRSRYSAQRIVVAKNCRTLARAIRHERHMRLIIQYKLALPCNLPSAAAPPARWNAARCHLMPSFVTLTGVHRLSTRHCTTATI
jgi:hypothetical protein